MRRIVLLCIVLLTVHQAFSQWVFQEISGDTCNPGLNYKYTCENYSFGNHGHGFKIYRNGNQVYKYEDSYGFTYLTSMSFLNDSTGFFNAVGIGVRKTTNYGVDWNYFPGIYTSPFNCIYWYFINPDLGYFFEKYRDNILLVERNTQEGRIIMYSDTVINKPDTNVDLYDTTELYVSCKFLNLITFKVMINSTVVNINIHFKPNPLSIDEDIPSGNYDIFPNPANETLYIRLPDFNDNKAIKVQLFSIFGVEVMENTYSNSNTLISIDLSKFSEGFYILVINDSVQKLSRKILKN
jgi:hypothetical protein